MLFLEGVLGMLHAGWGKPGAHVQAVFAGEKEPASTRGDWPHAKKLGITLDLCYLGKN